MKTALLAAAAASAALLVGCHHVIVPRAESFTAPDGRAAHAVHCGGDALSMTDCYAKAREICGGDYDVTNREESPRVYNKGGYVNSTQNRSIEFICKKQ